MVRKQKSVLFILTLGLVLNSAYAAQCPDTSAANNSPTAPTPAKTDFNHWGNSLLSSFYTPYHMVHDALVGQGEAATVVGKFDYDWTFHKDLEDEDVKVYLYGTGMNSWEFVGTYRTNSDGKIYVPVGTRPVGHYQVRMVVTGDLSSTTGYLTVVKPGTQAVLFDIDGTLTLNDFEAVGDYLGISTASEHYYAPETVNAYKNKGYCITYLTARPYWLMKDTREWFDLKNIPAFHAHSNPNAELFEEKDTATYKANYITSLLNSGLDIVRVYGNADTDIEAYERAGLPKSETYIIGDNAGDEGTQPISGDYSYHYSTVVVGTGEAE